MSAYVDRAGLSVDENLANFVEQEAMPGTGIAPDQFWSGFSALVEKAMPRNRDLLAIREDLQTKIDDWHKQNGAITADPEGYQSFLRDIGYLVEEPADFSIAPGTLDSEISTLCGPQLVVPVSNARYALNAANARWGSLYDALYGTDAIDQSGDLAPGKAYNEKRGAEVFARTAAYLDMAFPLASGSHADVTAYATENNNFSAQTASGAVALKDPTQFAGTRENGKADCILLTHRGLHAELVIDRENMIGSTHPAGLADLRMESALTTIQDCEDSVAAVDAEDKIGVYRNWLGLMNGSLKDTFNKGGKPVTRKLNEDITFDGANGAPLTLKGRALLLVRNVGHLMTTDAVKDASGTPIGEGVMDAAITALCALHDRTAKLNSRTGAIYVVKPKMHGPDEVAFACEIFAGVEAFLGLPENTIKIGIMDEERRTSANLKACVHAARNRVFFINTGFLDRTGDEIHTSMQAGPVLGKDKIKAEKWIQSYEDRNVMIGLECGLSGKAQIGKGMWAMPDLMAGMMEAKSGHPNAGANCAWVPSPTAGTLHVLHYHQIDVFEAQKRRHNEPTPGLDALFSMPVLDPSTLEAKDISRELENNAQGILGYVVRWVDQGVGCSKVPDINDVGLMEDRATLRISSQHIANWLLHGIITEDEIRTTFKRMAKVVDAQNAGDPLYQAMSGNEDTSIAYQAALKLALEGTVQPSGYTEPILHAMREKMKTN